MAIDETISRDFIRTRIENDVQAGKNGGQVVTRFPPEPNGYLHIGHAKAVYLSFSVAEEYNGRCHLRFDDTNPIKEETEYIDAIRRDIHWLQFDWGTHEYFASDYYEQLYEYAELLIQGGNAYVDSLTADQIRAYRGTLTEPGSDSPHKNRSIEENLDLFRRMRAGEFEDGVHVLRANIDMASPNLNMRDPTLYRIRHAVHHRTGDTWCIYPMYDFAHTLSDAIEGITHSLCDIGFEDHRPLYEWFLQQLPVPHHPVQIEFARLNITHTVLSKRRLRLLVEEKHVTGWDDPRMPTLSGLKRRGYTPSAVRAFIRRVGMSKTHSLVDIALFEHIVREELNKSAIRVMAVLDPVKVIITNFPEGKTESLEAENNPENPEAGTRSLTFTREIYIERNDFRLDPPSKYFRLAPGREVRLKHAYYITCNEVKTDKDTGDITEILCTYDPATKGGWSDDGRKIKGTLHWVSVEHAVDAEVRQFNHLFLKENPEDVSEGESFTSYLNPDSKEILSNCKLEKGLRIVDPEVRYQFLRQGYFALDTVDSTEALPVFNRIVSLRDSWAKLEKKMSSG